MVDPAQLTLDIVADAVSLALPAVLWAALFLLAWEHGPFAESIGFGRSAFWLLLPGAILASFALLPIAPVSYDWVAISFAGAVFPLIVGSLAFGRAAPPLRYSLARYLGFLAIESATLLVLVLPVADPVVSALSGGGIGSNGAEILLVLLASIVWVGIAFGLFGGAPEGIGGSARGVGFTLALTTGVLASTFAASTAIPGVGIVEQFPEYLIPPIGAGLLAVALAPRIFPGREGFALPVAYFASTFGVLVGADLLRQPPLYGTGPAGLYTIGGAGVLDLVYLSGLLALATAFLGHRVARRSFARTGGEPVSPSRSPVGLLTVSFRAGIRGQFHESISTADEAGREAAAQAHRLLELPDPPADRPWQGLPVPGWVVADQANLDAVAHDGTADAREGFRAWITARWMVYLARDLGLRRFGSVGARALGFVLDLLFVTLVGVAVWSALALTTTGGLDTLLDSVAFNAAIYGFVSVAFLYFVLAETLTGTSPGKRLVGLVVRDRRMRRPDFPAALVRNVSLLPVLTVTAIGGAIGVAFLAKASTLGTLVLDGVALPAGLLAFGVVALFLVGGIALLGGLGTVVMVLTSERQRLGDLWAGTWVVRSDVPVEPASRKVPAGVSAPPGPSGPGRSS